MIDTKAIRSKILDLAIRGKLTQQLPEDGTAEELYQQIQQEKSALIVEGKIKKSKDLPPITEEEIPFEIPENWKWVRLDSITSKIVSGNTPSGGRKSSVYVKSGYCFFREQNIYNDGIHEDGMVYITEELLRTRENSTVYAKDILLNITGGSIGRCAIVPDDFDKGSINQHILIIRPVDEVLRFYIHLLFCSPYGQKHIKNSSVGDKDGFSGGRCKLMLIPLPPIGEQVRITNIITQMNGLLEEIDLLQISYASNIETLKTKLIDAGIRGQLTERLPEDGTAEELYQQIQREKEVLIKAGKIKKSKDLSPIDEDEILFEIPENWKWVRLSMLTSVITDGTHHSPPNGATGAFMYITAKNIKPSGVQLDNVTYVSEEVFHDISGRCNPEYGDVLFIKDGATTGVVTVNNIQEPFAMLSSVALIKPLAGVSPWYIAFVLRSSWFYRFIRREMTGVGITRVVLRQIESFTMPLPPLAEQRRIVAKLEELLPLCDALR